MFAARFVHSSYSWLSGTLTPFSIGFVKGWRRSLVCLTLLEAIYTLKIDINDLTTNFKVGCFVRTICILFSVETICNCC